REPDDQRALVEVRDLYKEMERFLILFPGFKIRTEKSITQLRRVADDIDTCHRCASVATVVGSGTSAVGGTLLVAGLLAAPFTGGISLLLTGAGVVGGITSASASITETMMNKSKQGEVDEIIERYNSDSKLLMESFNMAYGAIDGLIRLSQTEIAAGLAKRVGIHPLSVGQKSYTLVSTILAKQTLAKTSRLQRLAMEVSELYGSLQSANFVESTARIKNLLFGMPHVVPSSAKLATKALSTAFVAWDIYSLVTETIDLRKGSRTELAQQVRAMADRIKEKLWAFQGIYRAIERYMLEGHGRGRRHAAIEGRF
ncbi:apolipoprotein L3-like, partial [Heptranchias perlo]|uniref:apolipoprotein L3-like n=1 Tax=Heptranchias perlo TaxID=212740 RepID=UPI00355A0D5A